MRLVNFRLPARMLKQLRKARNMRDKDYTVDVVREALDEYFKKYRIPEPKD